jgi:DNA-binding NarL/FixJ family response regulator
MPSTSAATRLSPELEAIAAAAADRVRASVDSDAPDFAGVDQRVRDAAGAAIAAGTPLGAIAAAEQQGQAQARAQLSPKVLKQLGRAAERKRDAELDYELEIYRAGRLGLSHREIATAVGVAHGTIRAILTRRADEPVSTGTPPSSNGDLLEHERDDNGWAR